SASCASSLRRKASRWSNSAIPASRFSPRWSIGRSTVRNISCPDSGISAIGCTEPSDGARRAVMSSTNDRPIQAATQTGHWQTSLTSIAPNRILIRGYPLDEMMGRLGFAEAVYLLLMGELPTPAIGRMLNAVLVSSLDHGVTPPSTLAARNVATSGAPLKDCVAAGILAFGPHHGGDIESCMRFLDAGLAMVRSGACRSPHDAAKSLVSDCVRDKQMPPGFGHRFHTRDPRAARLFQMALELELEGEHVRMLR